MFVIGLRTKNKDICKETVQEAGVKQGKMVKTGFYVPATVKLLWKWVHYDLGHPKSVRGQGNLNLVALPSIPDELEEKAELVLDYEKLKKNAKSIDPDLLKKRLGELSDVEVSKGELFDEVLVESFDVPEERTRRRGSQDKTDPDFELQEGDLCSVRGSDYHHRSSFPVVVTRRTSRNVWVYPVEFEAEGFEYHPLAEKANPTEHMERRLSAKGDEVKIITDSDGKPEKVENERMKNAHPKRFYIDKNGRWKEYGAGKVKRALWDKIMAEDYLKLS